MYHADPDGEKISIGFTRVPAADQDARRGALFAVPGGPGDSAYSFAGSEDYISTVPDDIGAEWDVVGVQPRGLAGSTPLDCDHEPEGWDQIRAQVTEAGGYLQESCELGTPDYTDSINTWEITEDINDVRDALGEEKISVAGVSYGTVAGSAYATKYPEHTDKLVLDSGMDTNRAWAGTSDDQTGGYTGALHDFLAWTAENNDTYGLGETPLEVYRNWSAKIVEESGTNPTVVPPPAEVGDLPPGLQIAGQPAADVLTAAGEPAARIENLFHLANTLGTSQSTSPTLYITHQSIAQPDNWGQLADMVSGREPTPTMEEIKTEQAEAFEQNPELASVEWMNPLLTCNEDQAAPDYTQIPETLWNTELVQDPFPWAGLLATSGIKCNGIEPDAPWTDINGAGLDTAPLQIQGTGDPQTVYRTHKPMAEAMGSHVITVDGPGHGQFGLGNEVVDNAVAEYLRTGHTDVTEAPSRPVE